MDSVQEGSNIVMKILMLGYEVLLVKFIVEFMKFQEDFGIFLCVFFYDDEIGKQKV